MKRELIYFIEDTNNRKYIWLSDNFFLSNFKQFYFVKILI